MNCPTLAELPPPPSGRTGWPWTFETTPLPLRRPGESPWPLISIVTPSYNQGEFIEETIRSVLLQGYPNIEYIIIDGGSSDQSVDIIQKYERWLAYWVSEEDRGQSHAINNGFERANGAVLSWLNSDDVMLPDALPTVAAALTDPKQKILIGGRSEYRDVSGTRSIWVVDRIPHSYFEVFSYFETYFAQPSVYFTREALKSAGPLSEDLHYAMDLDLWLRMCRHAHITILEQHLSWMRQHKNAKTWRDTLRVINEVENVLQAHSRHVASGLLKRSEALAKRARSQAWLDVGLGFVAAGDRKKGWLAAFRAAQSQLNMLWSRGWIGLVLRLILPRLLRWLVFGLRPAR